MGVQKGHDKLNRLFFTPEPVDLKGAFRKPRLGEAIYMFKDQNLERLFDTPTRTGQQAGKSLLKRNNKNSLGLSVLLKLCNKPANSNLFIRLYIWSRPSAAGFRSHSR
jgi:hypothetical protein